MHTNELWRLLADEPIADLPLNNLVPLLQNVGNLGVKINHILPFLADGNAQKRLLHFILGAGFELTDDEVAVMDIFDPKYILFAPAVLNVLGRPEHVKKANRKITIPRELLEKAASRNRDGHSVFQDQWRLVYCAPTSLASLSQIKFRHGVNLQVNRWGNCTIEESTQLPPESRWAHEVPEEGYYLVNYWPLNEEGEASDFVWRTQEDKIHTMEGPYAHRMAAAQYTQSLITHFALKQSLPWPTRANWPDHWAVNEPELKIHVEAKGSEPYNDYGLVKLFACEGARDEFFKSHVQGVYCYGPTSLK